jgi:hypothetical protein
VIFVCGLPPHLGLYISPVGPHFQLFINLPTALDFLHLWFVSMKLLPTFVSLFAFTNVVSAIPHASLVPQVDKISPHAAGLALNELENRALTCETILGKVVTLGNSAAMYAIFTFLSN